MSDTRQDVFATRGAQMFLRFTDDEIARLARFGEPRSYAAGEFVATPGKVGPGLLLILSGKLEVTRNDHGEGAHIVTHERGNFSGELANLSGRPSLIEARDYRRRSGSDRAGEAPRPADCRSRPRRADHARADPAPGGPDRSGRGAHRHRR
jgi:CRP-like cAMP-binding protein